MSKRWVIFQEMYKEHSFTDNTYGKVMAVSKSFEKIFKIYFEVFFLSEIQKPQSFINTWIYYIPSNEIPFYIKNQHAISKNKKLPRARLRLNFRNACLSLDNFPNPNIHKNLTEYVLKFKKFYIHIHHIFNILDQLTIKTDKELAEIIAEDRKSSTPKWIKKAHYRSFVTSFLQERAFAIKFVEKYYD